MLTKLTIRNFKRFEDAEIELGDRVLFVGPNNSGKTSALQALALWDVGVKRWNEKRGGSKTPKKRPGVAINRRDLVAIPVPTAKLLWQGLHTRNVQFLDGKQQTEHVFLQVEVSGVSNCEEWHCGLEFYYANEESFYCRPMRANDQQANATLTAEIPPEAGGVNVAFLPPMSGLAASETRLDPGAVKVRIGEGRTADVLRNLCHTILEKSDGRKLWEDMVERIRQLFGVELNDPIYVQERGEIAMTYREGKVNLDISSSGRGLQQTLLLLAYLTSNPNTVLLLDEPDAHLEILRQRQVYGLLADAARANNAQIVVASHSEVLMEEAGGRDVVVAFVGSPHRIDDRGSGVLKSLKEIGFDQYYQAEQTGWVLYLEGSTDLSILKAFARRLEHQVNNALERPFVKYVQQPSKARSHFFGLVEAKRDLVGFALFDHDDKSLQESEDLRERMWQRNEIENYLCQPETLLQFAEEQARSASGGPLLEQSEVVKWRRAMEESIENHLPRAARNDREDKWWSTVKATDDFLDRVFADFYKELGSPNLLRKTNYHELARFVAKDQLEGEVREVLDDIHSTYRRATPRVDTQVGEDGTQTET